MACRKQTAASPRLNAYIGPVVTSVEPDLCCATLGTDLVTVGSKVVVFYIWVDWRDLNIFGDYCEGKEGNENRRPGIGFITRVGIIYI